MFVQEFHLFELHPNLTLKSEKDKEQELVGQEHKGVANPCYNEICFHLMYFERGYKDGICYAKRNERQCNLAVNTLSP